MEIVGATLEVDVAIDDAPPYQIHQHGKPVLFSPELVRVRLVGDSGGLASAPEADVIGRVLKKDGSPGSRPLTAPDCWATARYASAAIARARRVWDQLDGAWSEPDWALDGEVAHLSDGQ